MPNFLDLLRNAADSVLGKGNHGYGYATDELVTDGDPLTKDLKRELHEQQYAPPDPNVRYPTQDTPRLQKMPALEPMIQQKGTPAQRLKEAAQRVIEKNRAIDEEVKRAKLPQKPKEDDGYDPDLI